MSRHEEKWVGNGQVYGCGLEEEKSPSVLWLLLPTFLAGVVIGGVIVRLFGDVI